MGAPWSDAARRRGDLSLDLHDGLGDRPDVLRRHRQHYQRAGADDQRRDGPRRHVVLVPDRALDLDRAPQQVPLWSAGPSDRRSRVHLRDRSADAQRVLLARQPGRAHPAALQSDVVSRNRPHEDDALRRAESRGVRIGELHALRTRTLVVDQLQGRDGPLHRRLVDRERVPDQIRPHLERHDRRAREPVPRPVSQELERRLRIRADRLRLLPQYPTPRR